MNSDFKGCPNESSSSPTQIFLSHDPFNLYEDRESLRANCKEVGAVDHYKEKSWAQLPWEFGP